MTRLFLRDLHSAPVRALTRRTLLRVGLLFGPLAAILVVLRLLQHSILKAVGQPALSMLLSSPAPPFLLILFVTILLGGVAFRSWPRVRPVWLITGTVLLGSALMIGAALFVPPWLAGWLTHEAFQVLRGDLLTLLVLALVFAMWLDYTRGWGRHLGLLVLHTMVPVLLLLPIFELSIILAMGTPLDGSLLLYTLRHLHELTPVLANEVGPAETVLLLLPLGLTLLPVVVVAAPAVRRWLEAPPSDTPRQAWQAMVAMLPLAAVCLLPPAVPLPPTHQTLSYAGMTRSLFAGENGIPDDLVGLTTPASLPFDTRTLRFVPTDATRRLNVVVVILESFRSRSVTPYTPDLPTTPFLDALAPKALLVEDMHAVVSYTNKALVPILTGVYPELSRENVEARPGALPATGLPSLLRPHGYRTAFFTPAKMSFEEKDQILRNVGFDEFYGDAAYPKEGFHVTNYFGYEDRVMLAPSMAWVDEVTAQDQPFFLSYLTLTSHHDYQVPPTFEHKPFADDPKLNAYLNALHYTDAFLKDLFDAFAQRGLLDTTVFVLLGDHGEAFGEHGQRLHGDVIWDEALETPAFLYNPVLFPEGGHITGNRSHIDILPTIADVLGYRIEGGTYPGLSLLQSVPEGRLVYHSARHGHLALALRQDSLKFFYYNRRQPMQVFNVHADPFERHDIADQLPLDALKAAELKLLLWRRGVQQIYHHHSAQKKQLAAR